MLVLIVKECYKPSTALSPLPALTCLELGGHQAWGASGSFTIVHNSAHIPQHYTSIYENRPRMAGEIMTHPTSLLDSGCSMSSQRPRCKRLGPLGSATGVWWNLQGVGPCGGLLGHWRNALEKGPWTPLLPGSWQKWSSLPGAPTMPHCLITSPKALETIDHGLQNGSQNKPFLFGSYCRYFVSVRES